MAEFLFEIGLEEIPARMIVGAQAELERRVVGMLGRERLVAVGVQSKGYSTPRRLAVWVSEVAARQADVAEELVGPSSKIAYKDGVPTAAAVAFAKKSGVAVEALKTVSTAKGEHISATSIKVGRGAAEVIAAELPKELPGIYWAKNMYWRAGKPERFVRPVRWMVGLLGGEVVPVEFAGKRAGRVTYGHRVLFGDGEISVASPGEYEAALLKAFVVADVEVRRQRIRKGLDRVCRTVPDTRWREDHELVDKLTHLVEWAAPEGAGGRASVVMGGFEAAYLELPEEVLVTVMRDHQSYFAVEDKTGKLAPHFLAVLNMEADEAGLAVIRHGNERVLRARFNDARFFWEFDQRVPLVERVKLLENVTFQKDLGSYAKKSERVAAITQRLATFAIARGALLNEAAIAEATLLAKTDLTTELVKEFTELQGQIGGLYAESQGMSEIVAHVIYDQYLPASAKDAIPRLAEGGVFGIADRIDTIAGMFRLGMEPTGSKDPFALRRAANSIVRILAESSLPLFLSDIVNSATPPSEIGVKLLSFFAERIDFYLREGKGFTYDVVKSVMAVGHNDIRDLVARAEALTAVRGSEDFTAVSAAFKRMKNILAQAKEKGILDESVEPSGVVQGNAAQNALLNAAGRIREDYTTLTAEHRYVEALELIATLRKPVDEFFEQVMVMDPDPYIRNTRLSLLNSLVQTFSKIADFSEIVTAG